MRWWTAKEVGYLKDHYGPLAPLPIPTAEIAKHLDKSSHQVRCAAHHHGLSSLPRVETWEHRRWMMRLYRKGLDDPAIAREVGCRRETVCRWRKSRGLPAHPKKGRPRIEKPSEAEKPVELPPPPPGLLGEDPRKSNDYIWTLINMGVTDVRIAEHCGVSRYVVAKVRKAHGLPPKLKRKVPAQLMTLTCCSCGREFKRKLGEVNQNAKRALRIFCSQPCCNRYVRLERQRQRREGNMPFAFGSASDAVPAP